MSPVPAAVRAGGVPVQPSRPLGLGDGSQVTVRAATASDEPALLAFLSALCLETRRLRFFTGGADIAGAAHQDAATGADRCGLIAYDQNGVVVGHVMCVELDAERAEIAVEVADHLHGRGLGTILIARLARIAERRGIRRFVAEVLTENRAMLDVFRDAFGAHVVHVAGPQEAIEFPTANWRLAPHATTGRYAVAMDADGARQLLARERERVEQARAALGADGSSTGAVSDEPGERDSQSLYQSEFDAGLSEDLAAQLAAVERAEARLAAGTYGLSIESGEPIGDQRLEALPTAELTVAEQERRERS